MSDGTGRIIYDSPEGPERGGWDTAPVEAVIENVRQGDIDAWKALLEDVGMTEEDFIKKVADEVSRSIDEDFSENKPTGTVE